MDNDGACTDKKVILITGGTKGIGRAIAESAVRRGDYHVVVTSRSLESAEAVAQELERDGAGTTGLAFDIEQLDDVERLVSDIRERFGRLDVLVNNAVSQSCLIPSEAFSDAQVVGTLTANIAHVYLLTRKAFPLLVSCSGCVINIGSVITQRYLKSLTLYGLAKGALNEMTQVLAAEWADDQVRVNAINPGFVRTQGFAELGMDQPTIDAAYEFYEQYQPLGGIVPAGAIGEAALFLMSAKSVTGICMNVDNGYSTRAMELVG